MKKKCLLVCVILLVASAMLFAQGNKEKRITLTFWDENAGETRTPYYEALIDRFNASQDRIVVVYEGIPSSSAKEKYDVAIATKTTPDIGHCNAAWGFQLACAGMFDPSGQIFRRVDRWQGYQSELSSTESCA